MNKKKLLRPKEIIKVLQKKGCKIDLPTHHLSGFIDIERATELGNKTWGYIDYLIKEEGFHLVGISAYKIHCFKKYASSAEPPIIKEQKVVKNEKSKVGLYHSYSAYLNDTPQNSESIRLRESIEMSSKVDYRNHSKKDKETRAEIKLRKKVSLYDGVTVFTSEHLYPLKQTKNAA